jgi:hypothetical protein
MKTTIDMARDAGFEAMRPHGVLPHVPEAIFIANVCVTEEVKRLVALIRADEREINAKVCESLPMQQEIDVRDECAAAIRARGNT